MSKSNVSSSALVASVQTTPRVIDLAEKHRGPGALDIIECKNTKMMGLLYGLGAEGPDSLLVNSVGWTVMHSAVNTDDLETIKKLVEHFTPARTKLLLATPDKSGREPLHIAAYKCTEDVVQYLISIGAKNARSDAAGNTAAKLAERAGRRRSRDIIEDPESAKAAGS